MERHCLRIHSLACPASLITEHISMILTIWYLYTWSPESVCLSFPPCFSQTGWRRKKNSKDIRCSTLKQRPRKTKFAATCMGLGPGQLNSPLFLPLKSHWDRDDNRIVLMERQKPQTNFCRYQDRTTAKLACTVAKIWGNSQINFCRYQDRATAKLVCTVAKIWGTPPPTNFCC
jgi:hypothetical protein